ncbi:MAG: type II secretion system F family protein [Actinomycetota bacterium]|nr:type II secretion system F family protein [Actinomycetota bacterium]
MNSAAAGAILGLLCASGLVLVCSRALALRPPSMLERMAPFVPATPQLRSRTRVSPGVGTVLLALVRPMIEIRGEKESLELRLVQAGRSGIERFRFVQASAIGIGAAGGALIGAMLAGRGAAAICLPLLVVVGALAGVLWADRQLAKRITMRQERMARELPAVAELLAFAAAAGESPAAAVERVCRTLGGELSHELQRCLGDVRGGQALDLALRALAPRVGSPEVERFIDAFVIALERGSPLVEVLRAQAADVRAADRRALMEKAGRKEVAMLLPVVFLILPTVVLVAVFPGVQGLQLFVRS